MKIILPPWLLMFALFACWATSHSQVLLTDKCLIAPIDAPFEMPQLQRPVFKDQVYKIDAYGAVSGGEIKNTEAIRKAITVCHENGGGTVVVPEGKWLTGPVHLKSNVQLNVVEGAELIFSDHIPDYLPAVESAWEGMDCYNYSPLIYSVDCENIGLTGKGQITCIRDGWAPWDKRPDSHMEALKKLYYMAADGVPVEERQFANDQARLRPPFIQFLRCKNVLIEGLTIRNSPFWVIHPLKCENVIARDLDVKAHGHNTDGIDPEQTKNMLIENCIFDQGDDAMVIKSGRNHDGWRGRPSENIVIRNCTIRKGHRFLAIGSEMSGGVRNVYLQDCILDSSQGDVWSLIYLKTNHRRGGFIENIYVKGVTGPKVATGVLEIYTDVLYQWKDLVKTVKRSLTPIRGIHLEDIHIGEAKYGIKIEGEKERPIRNITLKNVKVDKILVEPRALSNVEDIQEDNVFFGTQETPVLKRPNILLASADDWSCGHAGAYGCSWVRTPSFDRLAKEGILFTRAFTPNAKPSDIELALTPPMGWNSFMSYGVYLHEQAALANVDAMAEKLKPYGYKYFVIDNGWFGEYRLVPGTLFAAEKHASDVNIDEFGLFEPSHVYFPNGLKPIIDRCHEKGLKFGLHLMRGVPRKAVELDLPIKGTEYRASQIADAHPENNCTWCTYNYGIDMSKPGAQEFYDSLIKKMADMGVDFIKYDDIVPYPREVEAVAKAIRNSGRPIVLSLSPGDDVDPNHTASFRTANMLRVTPDIWDRQKDIDTCFEAWRKWGGYEQSGFWIDMDMIPFGQLMLMSPPGQSGDVMKKGDIALAGRGTIRKSQLTKDQMYTFITLRALAASPLMVGGDLPTLDDVSLKLLTEPQMLACNQNGVMGRLIFEKAPIEIWKAEQKGTEHAGWFGVFNRSDEEASITVPREQLHISASAKMHDVWNNRAFQFDEPHQIPANGVLFVRYEQPL